MGTDVGSNVIGRLMQSGYGRGKVSSTLACVRDNANWGASNPSYETRRGEALHLKILPAPLEFWAAFRPRPLSWTLMASPFTSMSRATRMTTPAEYLSSI